MLTYVPRFVLVGHNLSLITLTEIHRFLSATLSKKQHVFEPVCGWSAQLRVICSLGTSLCQTYPNLSPSLEPNSCIPYPSLLSETTPLFLSPGDWFPLLCEKKPSYLISFISVSQVYFLLRRNIVFGWKFHLLQHTIKDLLFLQYLQFKFSRI